MMFLLGILCGAALVVASGFLSTVARVVKIQRAALEKAAEEFKRTEEAKRRLTLALVNGFMDGIAAATKPKPSPPVSIPEPPSLVGKVH